MFEATIEINGHKLLVELADTPAEHQAGLSDYPSLPQDEGMLFIFENNSTHPMVMRDMELDLDMIHIDEAWAVNSVNTISKDDTRTVVGSEDSRFVLEINAGLAGELGIQLGTTVSPSSELAKHVESLRGTPIAKKGTKVYKAKNGTKMYDVTEDDVALKDNHLQVLNTEGEVTTNIQEGARIFSREHTEKLVSLSYAADTDADLAELGALMVEYIHTQDTQKPEYTT